MKKEVKEELEDDDLQVVFSSVNVKPEVIPPPAVDFFRLNNRPPSPPLFDPRRVGAIRRIAPPPPILPPVPPPATPPTAQRNVPASTRVKKEEVEADVKTDVAASKRNRSSKDTGNRAGKTLKRFMKLEVKQEVQESMTALDRRSAPTRRFKVESVQRGDVPTSEESEDEGPQPRKRGRAPPIMDESNDEPSSSDPDDSGDDSIEDEESEEDSELSDNEILDGEEHAAPSVMKKVVRRRGKKATKAKGKAKTKRTTRKRTTTKATTSTRTGRTTTVTRRKPKRRKKRRVTKKTTSENSSRAYREPMAKLSLLGAGVEPIFAFEDEPSPVETKKEKDTVKNRNQNVDLLGGIIAAQEEVFADFRSVKRRKRREEKQKQNEQKTTTVPRPAGLRKTPIRQVGSERKNEPKRVVKREIKEEPLEKRERRVAPPSRPLQRGTFVDPAFSFDVPPVSRPPSRIPSHSIKKEPKEEPDLLGGILSAQRNVLKRSK